LRQAAASLHPRKLSSQHLRRSQQHQPSRSLAASITLALRQSQRLLASAYQAAKSGSLSPTHQPHIPSSQRPAPATPQHQLHLPTGKKRHRT
jgi:hypothetical protein